MLKINYLQRAIIESIIVLCIAAILGAIFSYFLISIIIGLVLLLIWHCYNLYQLSDWIHNQNKLYPPSGTASFDVILYGLHKRQKRTRTKQNELAKIIKLFRSGIEAIPDSLIMTDNHGKIEWCNKIAQYELAIRWPDDKGQNIINLIRYPEFAKYMQKKEFDTPLTLMFGQKKHLEFRVIPYISDNWLVIARDVDQIYLAQKQRHDFFTNASHELRTPLTVIKGYLDMLSDGLVPDPEKEKTYLTMQAQASRMEQLIRQILMLSEIENTSINTQLQLVNIPDILQGIENNVRQIYPQYHFIFNVNQTLYVNGHKEQLYSAMSNLIYNAIKHTPEGTTITVGWQKTQQGAHFSVSDTGSGIAAHHLTRLTERFYQVDNARNNQQSSGLGLAIVKHALLNHANTRLDIKSELGKGSDFSFTLPKQYIRYS